MRIVVSAAFLAAAALSGAMPAVAAAPPCAKADALGVARTVEIDTTGGPGFGLEHYKAYDFLQPKEVVLTFDDGPQKFSTEGVLAALAAQCTKATFFTIGKMALGYPEIIREVAQAGHTIGTHTWSHQAISKLKTFDEGRDEIERGISAVKRAVGGPVSPFFRYPTLKDTPDSLAHLNKRNIAMFSTDIDSFDFKLQPPEALVKGVMEKLEKKGKGILLMHDIHKNTAKALPLLLTQLKEKGYKVVHLTAKGEVATLPEYDALIEKDAKGLPQIGSERPTASVVRTIGGDAPASETNKMESGRLEPAAALPVALPAAAPVGKAAELTPPPAAAVPVAAVPVAVAPAATAPVAPAAAPVAAQAAAPVATVGAPVTTSSISTERPAGSGEPPKAEAVPAAAQPKTMTEKVQAIWEMWFGK